VDELRPDTDVAALVGDSIRKYINRDDFTLVRDDDLFAVVAGEDPMGGAETLKESERESERVYLGLRTTDGLALRQNEWTTVTPWMEAGWATRQGDRLVLTPTGWLRLDALAASLTSLRSRS